MFIMFYHISNLIIKLFFLFNIVFNVYSKIQICFYSQQIE